MIRFLITLVLSMVAGYIAGDLARQGQWGAAEVLACGIVTRFLDIGWRSHETTR